MATLGIDVGGTNARAAVVDADGRIIAAAKTALVDRSPDAVVKAIAESAATAIRNAGVPVHGCGIGVAGQLVGDTGVIAVAPNLGWRDVPIRELLTRALGRPVRVVNDLTAAAWGELKAGAGKGARNVYVVFAGSGVGSAIIIDGKLYTGTSGVAGELGHVKVVPGGRRCGCGMDGCLEAYAGGHNLIGLMKDLIAAGKGQALLAKVGGDASKLNPAILEQVAADGDPSALELHGLIAGYLSYAVANQITVLNPERLILGGGVLSHTPLLRKSIEETIARTSSTTSRATVKVVSAALGDDSGIIGAALLADAAPAPVSALEDRSAATELELLEQELRALDQYTQAAGAPSAVAPPPPAQALISAQMPGLFTTLCDRYGEVLSAALDRDAYRGVATDPSSGLRALSDKLTHVGAGPRDVVELHARVLREKTQGAPPPRAKALVAEGRILVLELMGHLAANYRKRALGSAGPGGVDG